MANTFSFAVHSLTLSGAANTLCHNIVFVAALIGVCCCYFLFQDTASVHASRDCFSCCHQLGKESSWIKILVSSATCGCSKHCSSVVSSFLPGKEKRSAGLGLFSLLLRAPKGHWNFQKADKRRKEALSLMF